MSIISFEIEEVQKICENVIPNSKIIACNPSLVRIDIKQTRSRQLTACIRFPENYPEQSLLIELKSKTLCDKFLDGLTTLAEQKAKESLGKPQIINTLKFISQYLQENPLCIVLDEIIALRKLLSSEAGDLKLKQKNSTISLTARGGNYYFKIKTEIPEEYPEKCVKWQNYESNLPAVLVRFLNGQGKEIARQCVEPPLAQPKNKKLEQFQPSPSLLKAMTFIIEATREFCTEVCPICNEYVLPRLAEDIVANEQDDSFVERVYCGHLFHQGCLKKYVNEPPFPPGGKTCPATKSHPRSDAKHLRVNNSGGGNSATKSNTSIANKKTCGIRLAHDRWVVNVKVAESRWAQKQARERELEEVVDFLQ